MTDHPLTEDRAAELWDEHREPGVVPFHEQRRLYAQGQTAMLRAAFDAGREHERTTPAAVSAEPLARTSLGVPAGHGAPHHDVARIKPGDFVLQVDRRGFIRAGIAHHRDGSGDWITEGGRVIACAALRADRPDALTIWTAPTPPAEEVEMSGVPCVLTDVQFREVLAAGVALWTGLEAVVAGFNGRAVVVPASDLAAFTLPDGTRARRDGNHGDGTPRFVKVREVEK
ncbi:hypothetical protein [Fictibacillus arsenicus]|uniref:hypothetical protein n=1 Tax=Fictibacillus arsenicus TaxID=255247 RepID=UPI0011156535|nr:hypothetical protein [Fictibacillus arsenicus]